MNIGDKVTYFPKKLNELDNRHFSAEIVGFTKSKRVQIVYQTTYAPRKATVAAHRLEPGQQELSV